MISEHRRTIFDAQATVFCNRAFRAYCTEADGDADKALEIAYRITNDMSIEACQNGEREFRRLLKNPEDMDELRSVLI